MLPGASVQERGPCRAATFADMTGIDQLLLPILASAAFVFVASSVIHMLLPVHKGDYGRLPDEDATLEALRNTGVVRGHYMFPCPGSVQEMGSPGYLERARRGPVGFLVVREDGPPRIGRSLLQWFAFCLVVSTAVAWLVGRSTAPGTDAATVFTPALVAACLGHALANVQDSIWKGVSWRISAKFAADGIVYGLATAAAFAWLWPTG